MAREEQNLDPSTVVFKTEIMYGGKKYEEPLYKISDRDLFTSKFKKRSGRRPGQMCHQLWALSYNIQLMIRSIDLVDSGLDRTKLEHEIRHPRQIKTELDNAFFIQTEINAMRALYYACLDWDESPNTEIEQMFQLLFLSTQYYSACRERVVSDWNCVSSYVMEIPQVLQRMDHDIESYLSPIADLEFLYSVYTDFHQQYEETLRAHEHRFNEKFNSNTKTARNGVLDEEAPNMSCYIYFWQSKKFSEELRGLFWYFCQHLPTSDMQATLFNMDVRELVTQILNALDKQLEEKLKESRPTICTIDTSVRWQANSLEAAEYLCLYSDLVHRKKYRICPICGALFELTAKYKSKLYCDLHDANQIQYYRRKLNEI